MFLRVTTEELRDMVNCRAGVNARENKKAWWRAIRSKYGAPDVKLKVDMDTGDVRYKGSTRGVEVETSYGQAAAVAYPTAPAAQIDLTAYGFFDEDDGIMTAYTGDGALQAIFDHEDRPVSAPIHAILICSPPIR